MRDYVQWTNQPDLKRLLRDYVSHLSPHQQSQIPRANLDFINERKSAAFANEKTQLEAAIDEEIATLRVEMGEEMVGEELKENYGEMKAEEEKNGQEKGGEVAEEGREG